MSLFILPDYMLESERTQQLLVFMESDIQHFYDYVDWLYQYISIDYAESDYVDDAGKFLGLESLKFRYSEENKAKSIKNLYGLIKFLGSSRALRTILMTYSLDIELKYLWTDDFITYTEGEITDIIYPYGKKHYLSSYLLNRVKLTGTIIEETSSPIVNLVSSEDFGNYIIYEKNEFIRLYETYVIDEERDSVYQMQRGANEAIIIIPALGNDLGPTYKDFRVSIDVKSNIDLKVRCNLLGGRNWWGYPPWVSGSPLNNRIWSFDDLTDDYLWDFVNATTELVSDRILGNILHKITSLGSGCSVKQTIVPDFSTDGMGMQFKLKKGNADNYYIRYHDDVREEDITKIKVTFSTKTIVGYSDEVFIDVLWVHDDEVLVKWKVWTPGRGM